MMNKFSYKRAFSPPPILVLFLMCFCLLNFKAKAQLTDDIAFFIHNNPLASNPDVVYDNCANTVTLRYHAISHLYDETFDFTRIQLNFGNQPPIFIQLRRRVEQYFYTFQLPNCSSPNSITLRAQLIFSSPNLSQVNPCDDVILSPRCELFNLSAALDFGPNLHSGTNSCNVNIQNNGNTPLSMIDIIGQSLSAGVSLIVSNVAGVTVPPNTSRSFRGAIICGRAPCTINKKIQITARTTCSERTISFENLLEPTDPTPVRTTIDLIENQRLCNEGTSHLAFKIYLEGGYIFADDFQYHASITASSLGANINVITPQVDLKYSTRDRRRLSATILVDVTPNTNVSFVTITFQGSLTSDGGCPGPKVEGSFTVPVTRCTTKSFCSPQAPSIPFLTRQNEVISLQDMLDRGDLIIDNLYLQSVPIANTGINALKFQGATINVGGKLVLDYTYKVIIFDACKFVMEEGAEIIVPQYADVTFEITNLSGCDKMWKGITVEKDGALTFTKDSEISDAQFAIELQNGANIAGVFGTFSNNHVGIYVPENIGFLNNVNFNYPNPNNNLPYIGGTQLAKFKSNGILKPHYTGQSDLIGLTRDSHAGDRSYAGFLFYDLIYFRSLSDPIDPSRLDYYTEMSNLRNGVVARRSNIHLEKLKISEMINDNLTPSTNYWASSGKGIFLYGGDNFDLVNCSIRDANYGIYTFNPGRLGLFHSNHFATNAYGIFGMTGSPSGFRGSIGSTLGQNYFEGNPNNVGINLGGIGVRNSNPTSFSIQNNIFNVVGKDAVTISSNHNDLVIKDNIVSGFSSQGISTFGGRILLNDCESSKLQNNRIAVSGDYDWGIALDGCQKTQVRKNNISYSNGSVPNMTGVYVSGSTSNWLCDNTLSGTTYGVQYLGICDQGRTGIETKLMGTSFEENDIGINYIVEGNTGSQKHFENYYSGNRVDASAASSPSSVFSSPYYLNDPSGLVIDPPNDWFLRDIGRDRTCNSNDEPERPLIGKWTLFGSDSYVASGGKPTNALEEGAMWTQQQNLFARLKEHPELIGQNQAVDAFFNANINGNIGKFYKIGAGIQNLYFEDTIAQNAYTALKDTSQQLFNQILGVDTLIRNRTTGRFDSNRVAQKRLLMVQLHSITMRINGYERILEAQMREKVGALLQNNAAIVAVKDYEVIEQSVNEIYLKMMLSPDRLLNQEQRNLVHLMAGQCPVSGGDAVYRARGLQKQFENIDYNNKNLCQNQTHSMVRTNPIQTNFIYPNPSTGSFTIQLQEPTNDDSRLVISNIYGQVVGDYKLSEGQSIFSFDNLLSVSGLYICNIMSSSRTLYSQKLIISR
jgi:Secretion system C-terminal sorting domain